MERHAPLTLLCRQCGTSFTRRYSYHRHLVEKRGVVGVFCSRACKGAGERRPLPAEALADYVGGMSMAIVAQRYGVSPEHVRHALQAAGIARRSKTAHLLGERNPTRGKGHSAAARDKIRAANVQQFSDPLARALAAHNQRQAMALGKIASVSKIEDRVAAELDRLGVRYTRQWGIRGSNGQYCACVDFWLESGVALEVQGTYWHADPRVYPNGPIHASQRHTVETFERKKVALAGLSVPLIELWELDIRRDLSVVARALGLSPA